MFILQCKKKVGKLVRFKQKGQKQASFLAFHKCCQGCLLRGPRYISTSFILVCALRCNITTGYQESLFVGWKVYSSSTNKAKHYSYSIFVQQMYWLQDKIIISSFFVEEANVWSQMCSTCQLYWVYRSSMNKCTSSRKLTIYIHVKSGQHDGYGCLTPLFKNISVLSWRSVLFVEEPSTWRTHVGTNWQTRVT